jgi:hypothetical protein
VVRLVIVVGRTRGERERQRDDMILMRHGGLVKVTGEGEKTKKIIRRKITAAVG